MTATDLNVPAPSRPMLPSSPAASYFRTNTIAAGVQQVVLFLVFGGLAVSRAGGHVLSAAAVCGIVTVAAFGSAVIGWVTNVYTGAFHARMGAIAFDEQPEPLDADPLSARTLWRTTLIWALGAAAWAASGAGLLVVVLNGRVVRFPAMFLALVCLAGVNVLAISAAARRLGVASAYTPPAIVVPLRRRAWLQLALPIAVTQGLVNAGVAWLLFHSYPTGNLATPGVLTDSVALADALLVVVPLTALFAGITVYWGSLDRMTGRVTLDDPDTQTVPRRSPIGPQFIVYAAIVGLVAFKLAAFALPATPSLAAVIITRGLLATFLVFVATGMGYIRGACNEVRA